MTAKRSTGKIIAAMVLFILVLAVIGGVWYLRRPKVEDRYPVTKQEVAIAHATQVVKSPDMWVNQRTVTQKGADGVEQVLTYYHERLVNGQVTTREEIAAPAGKPARVVLSRPTTEVVVVGTRRGARYAVNASSKRPQQIGAIGLSGKMWVEASGTVLFSRPGGTSGIHGNPKYMYYWTPVRDDIAPGALLFRVASGDWNAVKELKRVKNAFLLEGRPGDKVWSIVNDAPSYFDDNQGSFTVLVWPDGAAPK